ncbi:MAG: hypothetical protein HKN05_20690, partial [Rhizobiales bacterium]|nr:hypothetical protein [Hyphomicrobiales bacterium]
MKTESWHGPIPRDLVGDNAPSVRSGDDAALYGSAVIEPLGPVEVRTHQSFVLRYTAGKIGLDDTGGIQVCFRMISDAAKPQTTDPTKPGYLTATCSGEGSVRLTIGPYGQRPWNLAVNAE